VGIALIEDLETTFEPFRIHMKEKTKRCACSATAIIPSALVAIIVPEAFVKVLGFAGMILSVIAIFLPSFLLSDLKEDIRFELLRRKECIRMLVMFGIRTVICEIFSLI
jgi:tyrosine-specific transport protein